MTDRARLRIAAAATAVFIAAISFAGVNAHSTKPVGAVVQPSAGAQPPGPSQPNAVIRWQEGEAHD